MMETNELTRTLKTQLIPKAALIAYASEDDKNFFLEIRDINDRGNMAEGRPITQEFMNELVKGYSERHSSTPYGKVPSNLIYCDSRKGSERYVWYNPPHKRMMFFSSDLKIENAEYNLPGVIYEAGEHGMRIYAYKDDMPGKDTRSLSEISDNNNVSVPLCKRPGRESHICWLVIYQTMPQNEFAYLLQMSQSWRRSKKR